MFIPGKFQHPSVKVIETELRQRRYQPLLIAEEPKHHFTAHQHAEHHIIVGVAGHMRIRVENQTFTIKPGDELTIPPEAEHEAWVGPAGCSYFWVEY